MATELKGETVLGMEQAEEKGNLRGRDCFSVTGIADAKNLDLQDGEQQELKTQREDNGEKVKKAAKRHRMCQLKASQTQIFGLTESSRRKIFGLMRQRATGIEDEE